MKYNRFTTIEQYIEQVVKLANNMTISDSDKEQDNPGDQQKKEEPPTWNPPEPQQTPPRRCHTCGYNGHISGECSNHIEQQ